MRCSPAAWRSKPRTASFRSRCFTKVILVDATLAMAAAPGPPDGSPEAFDGPQGSVASRRAGAVFLPRSCITPGRDDPLGDGGPAGAAVVGPVGCHRLALWNLRQQVWQFRRVAHAAPGDFHRADLERRRVPGHAAVEPDRQRAPLAQRRLVGRPVQRAPAGRPRLGLAAQPWRRTRVVNPGQTQSSKAMLRGSVDPPPRGRFGAVSRGRKVRPTGRPGVPTPCCRRPSGELDAVDAPQGVEELSKTLLGLGVGDRSELEDSD